MDAEPTEIVLWVPARTDSIHLLRTVAASSGARSELTIDQIDDVRLAVTEAASQLLAGHGSGSTICLRLDETEGGLRVGITLQAAAAGGRQGGANGYGDVTVRSVEGSLAWHILLALGEDVHPIADAREVGVTFSKSRRRGEAG